MSLRDAFFNRLDDFQFQLIKRRSAFQAPGRTISFRNSINSQERKSIPTFGADSSGFGEDWASYRLPKTTPVGPLPLEHHENIHGHVSEQSQPLLQSVEEYRDPATSRTFKRTSEATDQRAIIGNREGNIEWDGVVRTEARKSFLSSMPKGGPTPADLAAEDLKHYDFDFST